MSLDLDLDDALRHIDRLSGEDKEYVLNLLEKRERLQKIEKARGSFIDFVKLVWPDFIPGAHHYIMAEAFERVARGECKRLIINMAPRHDLRLDQLVPTTQGFKKIGEIAKGDMVFGPHGEPRLVTGKSPVNRKPTYTVTTSDGAELVVSEDHLWTVRLECESDGPLKTLSTKALYERQLAHPNTSKTPKLPRMAPAQYPVSDLPIDPYVLGVWLGDGSSRDASIGCSFADLPAMRAQVEAQGYKTSHNPKYQKFNVLGLNEQLRTAGLFKNKHIPDAYLCASVEQRLALLQGLIDTDGSVSHEGKVTFNNTNDRLIEGVLCLVRSFGVKAKKTHRQTSYKGKPSQPSMRVMFKLANAARLPRKAERCRALEGNWSRTIQIEPTGFIEETQCLQVANEDGLFLAGRGYLVTHNTKSELTSWLLPAWFLGKFPKKKIIQSSNTEALAAGFGRRVRNLIAGEQSEDDDGNPGVAYTDIFPGVRLAKDSQAAAGWSTSKGGEYFAIGIRGKVTGKGGDIVIIDDPHSEQEARQAETSPEIFDDVYEWYTSGPRQRLQPGGSVIVVMTRWSKRDLSGQVLKKQAALEEGEPGDRWEVIEFPAILDEGTPEERSLWPSFWTLEDLRATRAVLPISKWKAQYQQNPTSEEGAIIKRESWRKWGSDKEKCPADHLLGAWNSLDPPPCEFIMMSVDTALTKTQRSDYSAFTTWGVFKVDDPATGLPINNIVLLSAYKERMEFPELKKKVLQFYNEDMPDTLLIENKGSGISLIQELRAMDVAVEDFSFGRGGKYVSNDKVARANMVSDIFASGYVWAPERRFAEECIEECAEFPYGDHDDYVDSVVQALLRFRSGGLIRTANDMADDSDQPRQYRAKRFY